MMTELVRDSQARRDAALYLCMCHAYGWLANDDGLNAFNDQVDRGLRGPDGKIIWGRIGFECSN